MSRTGSYSLRVFFPLALAALAAAAALAGAASAEATAWPPDPYPSGNRVDAARELAAATGVAFAVVDRDGGVRGYDEDAVFSSASASKALLLAAELRRLRDEDAPLDDGTRALLEPMITYSDNDAASAIYARVGDAGMTEVAQRAGMRSFGVDPGFWGGAQITAADLGRFYFGLDRALVGPYEDYGKRLLTEITSTQRWGIPEGAGRRWNVYFKGGWRPSMEGTTGAVTHQGALLEHDSGRRIGLAVLSNLSPGSTSYAAIEGITRRLLRDPPAETSWPAN